MNNTSKVQHPMRILGVFAHPDDESFCAGGTFARNVGNGAEVMVVSATRGEAGQINSAGLATRRTLGRVREQEFHLACQQLGVQHALCLDLGDGMLMELGPDLLTGQVCEIIRSFRPDVVITFGPDGGFGHPDHIAISAATTAACRYSGDSSHFPEQLSEGLVPHQPAQLYHCRDQLLTERLAHWLVGNKQRFQGTGDFAHALLLIAEASTVLHYCRDHLDVNWYVAGFSIIEQGERSNSLYLILSGRVDIIREEADGTQHVIARLDPGAFFGAEELIYQSLHKASVVAAENTTCLVLSPNVQTTFQGRGEDAHLTGITTTQEPDERHTLKTAIGLDTGLYLQQKITAIAAHRSQYPIQPDMLPLSIFRELMGCEYFVPVSLVSEVEPQLLAIQTS
jgi:LmbE family N-acetylglucosaminyl deacetylase